MPPRRWLRLAVLWLLPLAGCSSITDFGRFREADGGLDASDGDSARPAPDGATSDGAAACADGLDAGRGDCSVCARLCEAGANAIPECESGECARRCEPHFGDCDDEPLDCETDLRRPSSCGECGTVCEDDQVCAVAESGARCLAECPEETTRCGRSCVDTEADPANCGECGNRCQPDHATGACSSGRCVIGRCDPGWVDCNGGVEDGCEAALQSGSGCEG